MPAKVECDAGAELEFVYTQESTKLPLITVAHASGDRSEAGCLTLTKLYDWLAAMPDGVPEVSASVLSVFLWLYKGSVADAATLKERLTVQRLTKLIITIIVRLPISRGRVG